MSASPPHLHAFEKLLLGAVAAHLCFLPWALGTMHLWSEEISLGFSVASFALAILPRQGRPRLLRFPILARRRLLALHPNPSPEPRVAVREKRLVLVDRARPTCCLVAARRHRAPCRCQSLAQPHPLGLSLAHCLRHLDRFYPPPKRAHSVWAARNKRLSALSLGSGPACRRSDKDTLVVDSAPRLFCFHLYLQESRRGLLQSPAQPLPWTRRVAT